VTAIYRTFTRIAALRKSYGMRRWVGFIAKQGMWRKRTALLSGAYAVSRILERQSLSCLQRRFSQWSRCMVNSQMNSEFHLKVQQKGAKRIAMLFVNWKHFRLRTAFGTWMAMQRALYFVNNSSSVRKAYAVTGIVRSLKRLRRTRLRYSFQEWFQVLVKELGFAMKKWQQRGACAMLKSIMQTWKSGYLTAAFGAFKNLVEMSAQNKLLAKFEAERELHKQRMVRQIMQLMIQVHQETVQETYRHMLKEWHEACWAFKLDQFSLALNVPPPITPKNTSPIGHGNIDDTTRSIEVGYERQAGFEVESPDAEDMLQQLSSPEFEFHTKSQLDSSTKVAETTSRSSATRVGFETYIEQETDSDRRWQCT